MYEATLVEARTTGGSLSVCRNGERDCGCCLLKLLVNTTRNVTCLADTSADGEGGLVFLLLVLDFMNERVKLAPVQPN